MAYDDQLFLHDAYQKECDATISSISDGKFVLLDQTVFYPNAGGQAHDTGIIKTEDGTEYPVVYVGKFDGKISHQVEIGDKPPLQEGMKVHCTIDWKRRYKLMRSHTAAHVVSAVIAEDTGAQIHGNAKTTEKVRVDFNLEKFDKEYMRELIDKSNEILKKNLPVSTYFITKEELALKPEMMKLAKGLPDGVKEIRIVDIEGFDKQPCGGTHIKNLSEIGPLEFMKAENRGTFNRRVYFKIKDSLE
jgi:misacylated tRNA(Ala) deacylase